MILADYTFHFTIDYVMYPAAVAAAGMAFAIAVKILRKFDLSAFPFWIPLMVVGAGAFGFAVADMPKNATLPEPPDLITANTDSSNAKRTEIAKAHYEYLDKHPVETQQEPRMLPRWADGLMCVGGAGLFLCGLILMFCGLHEKYGNHSVAPRIAAKWQNELDIIKKMIIDCVGVPTSTQSDWHKAVLEHLIGASKRDKGILENIETLKQISQTQVDGLHTVLETGIKKSIGDWAASCHTRMAAIEQRMDKIVSDLATALPQASTRWEKWDLVQKEHGERLNAIQNKLRELQTANNSDLLSEIRTEQISLQKMMEQALKYPAQPVAEVKPLVSNPLVLCSGSYTPPPVVVTSGSISWPVIASGSIGGGAWEQTAIKSNPTPQPVESPKPSEWVKWSDFKPEVGSKINWSSQGDGCVSGDGVYVVVEDWDEQSKKPKFISAKWVKTNARIDAQWRYVDGKLTPIKKETERIDGWVRWRDEKPQVGRKMRWGDRQAKPDPEWWTGGNIDVTDKFLHGADLATGNHAYWWKYVDEPQADKLKAEGWIPVAERLPRSNEVANCHDMGGGQVAILGCKETTAYFALYHDTFYKIAMGMDTEARLNPTHWKPII